MTGDTASSGCRCMHAREWRQLDIGIRRCFQNGYRLVLLPQQGVFERQKGQKLRTPNTRNTFLAAATDAWIFLALPGSPAEMNMQVYCTRRVAFNRETSMWSGYRLIAVKRPSPTCMSAVSLSLPPAFAKKPLRAWNSRSNYEVDVGKGCVQVCS